MIKCASRLLPLCGTGTLSVTQNLHSHSQVTPLAERVFDRWEKDKKSSVTTTNQVSSNVT
jgi:hypothetical protein